MCILLYVDDLVITGSDLAAISKVKSQMFEAFEMKDLGDLHYFLRIEVIHTPDGILLSQRHYVLNMLYKFGMTDRRPTMRNGSENLLVSLIYLMITRSDLNYPVDLISQFMQRPT